MLVPLYGFLRGDTMGLLVLVHDHDTIETVAATLQQAAAARVAPRAGARVYVRGRALEPTDTVAQAGLTALDRIDVIPVAGGSA
ncbi:MAG TPA: toluene-4-monooxygenase system B family protein [Kofleriaceae bacterium]|nr:toluene-4-monooxygenase system B family protein [Kofleriaceae bacterium]